MIKIIQNEKVWLWNLRITRHVHTHVHTHPHTHGYFCRHMKTSSVNCSCIITICPVGKTQNSCWDESRKKERDAVLTLTFSGVWCWSGAQWWGGTSRTSAEAGLGPGARRDTSSSWSPSQRQTWETQWCKVEAASSVWGHFFFFFTHYHHLPSAIFYFLHGFSLMPIKNLLCHKNVLLIKK